MANALMPVAQAQQLVSDAARVQQETECCPLAQGLGRVLAEDIRSSVDVPPLDNSAMDGYALRFADLGGLDQCYAVSQRIPAGSVGSQLATGSVARIFTGAPIPPGADTVIMQENVDVLDDGRVRFRELPVSAGRHIRPRGQDIASGSIVLRSGHRLQPQDIGLLASIGVAELAVLRRLKVAVLSTGDELVEPGDPLGEGQIYNSNRYMLSAMFRAWGCEVVDGGIVLDDFDSTRAQLEAIAGTVDLMVSSGGVSVGEEDHVKAAVESLGELSLWKINIKPGKPLAFGRVRQTPFFGLPGNPTSAFVTAALFVRPYILRSQGVNDLQPLRLRVPAGFAVDRLSAREEYLRVRLLPGEQGFAAQLYANQSSGVLASTSWANALAIIPPQTAVSEGSPIDVLLFSELLH